MYQINIIVRQSLADNKSSLICSGFYTLKGEDGRDRRVDYVADANGFRATISTNELGTSPKNSADGKLSKQLFHRKKTKNQSHF